MEKFLEENRRVKKKCGIKSLDDYSRLFVFVLCYLTSGFQNFDPLLTHVERNFKDLTWILI